MALPQEKSAKDWFNRIIANPIRISVWVLILSVFVVVGLTFYFEYYEPDFFKNVLIEAHGMLFEILVIGLFVLWLNNIGEKRRTVQSYIDEIDDFRGWESEEAMRRIKGNILRLNKLGVSKIPLSKCHLENVDLKCANLKGASLAGANLKKANLWEANLEGANLEGANLEKVTLAGANLKATNLLRTRLMGANLMGTLLSGANLSGANLLGVTIFSFDQICQALTLYQAKLDDNLSEEIELKRPDLLKEPILENIPYVTGDGLIAIRRKDIVKTLIE